MKKPRACQIELFQTPQIPQTRSIVGYVEQASSGFLWGWACASSDNGTVRDLRAVLRSERAPHAASANPLVPACISATRSSLTLCVPGRHRRAAIPMPSLRDRVPPRGCPGKAHEEAPPGGRIGRGVSRVRPRNHRGEAQTEGQGALEAGMRPVSKAKAEVRQRPPV